MLLFISLFKYPSKHNVSQILLSCFDDEKTLIDDVKIDPKDKQIIIPKDIINGIWVQPSLKLKIILNTQYCQLSDVDEIKLILCQQHL